MAKARKSARPRRTRAPDRGPAPKAARKTAKHGDSKKPSSRHGKGASAPKLLARANVLAGRGAHGAALRAAQAALKADPDHWQAGQFLAALLWQTEHRDEAMGVLDATIRRAPAEAETQLSLVAGFAQVAMESRLNMDRAIELAEEAMTRYPPTVRLVQLLTILHLKKGSLSQALAAAERAIALDPANRTSHCNAGAILMSMGRGEDAVAAFARGLIPVSPGAATMSGKDSADRLRRQYADLAGAYDDNELNVSFSARMADLILKTLGATTNKTVLDAGCGTGLLGARLKARMLVGIDLSPDMLAKARARNVYAELVEGDLVAMMARRDDRFDIIASSCALYHFLDLGPFFREAARLLAPNGYLFLSVDPAPDSMDVGEANPGEYAHSRAYLRRLAAKNGLAEMSIKIMPHRTYPGFWCTFRRTATPGG